MEDRQHIKTCVLVLLGFGCQALASALNTAPDRLVWAHGASDVILRTALVAAKRAGVRGRGSCAAHRYIYIYMYRVDVCMSHRPFAYLEVQ